MIKWLASRMLVWNSASFSTVPNFNHQVEIQWILKYIMFSERHAFSHIGLEKNSRLGLGAES